MIGKSFIIFFYKNLQNGKTGGSVVIFFSLALLFILSATYFYWFHSDIFFYQENRSLFIFSSEYLQKFTKKPGGLLEYAANFLTQWYFNTVSGSLLVSSLFVLVCIVFIEINKQLSADKSFSLVFVLLPSCLLLVLQKSYDHLMYNNIGFLVVAIWFLFSVFMENKRLGLIIPGLFPFFFYIAGSFALIYLGMYIIYGIFYQKGIQSFTKPVSLTLIAFLTFLLFKEVLFLQPVNHLLRYPIPIINFSGLPVFLYLLCGYIILFPLVIKTIGLVKQNKKISGVLPLITVLIVFLTTLCILSRPLDPVLANIIEFEKFVNKQDWDSIIKQHESTPATNIAGQYYYNLALSEKGQLCDRLFYSRQDFGTGSLALPHDDKIIDKDVYFYYAVGLINEAHHLAVESMVKNGYIPENIKFLIKTELINRNLKVAERFINVLKKTLHYRCWAEKYEKMIYDTALLYSDSELREKIKMLPKKDFFLSANDMQNIELILISNPDNKIAFEYKLARLLFEKDVEAIVKEVKKIKEMGYTRIPRYIEQAILEEMNSKKEVPDMYGLAISSETELLFKQYMRDYNLNKNIDRLLFEEKMKNSWGKTFWFYNEFR
jgi:hypothetical protein